MIPIELAHTRLAELARMSPAERNERLLDFLDQNAGKPLLLDRLQREFDIADRTSLAVGISEALSAFKDYYDGNDTLDKLTFCLASAIKLLDDPLNRQRLKFYQEKATSLLPSEFFRTRSIPGMMRALSVSERPDTKKAAEQFLSTWPIEGLINHLEMVLSVANPDINHPAQGDRSEAKTFAGW